MELQFTAETHKYETIKDPARKWISATGILKLFTEPFDQEAVALACSKKKKSKWYGMIPRKIIELWDKESKRATDLGSWYHDQREEGVASCETVRRNGIDLPVVRPIMEGDLKLSPNQSITPGIYPEHFVYLKSAMMCGQADRVEVVGNVVNVYDYKTNKKLKEAYTNWEGKTKMMQGPLAHIEDSDLMHYALQLSIYMYIIIKHNPKLRPGSMFIYHIQFEEEGKDDYGYPITKYTDKGDPIVKEVVQIPVPYLKDEVISIIHYLSDNRHKLKK